MSNLASMFRFSRKSQSNIAEWSKDDDKLMHAVEQDSKKDVQRLVQKKKLNPNKLDPQGHSAFHLAAMRNRFQVLQLFLAYGAAADAVDGHGMTPLHCAARHGAAEALKVLLHHKDDAWPPDKDGMTALHHACISGNADCIISLLRKFPSSINAVDQDGRTALCHAAHIGHTNVCRELLDRQASPNAVDKHGRSCLMYAAENGNTAVSELLLSHGAQLELTDRQGHTALWYAIDGGHSGVKFLLEKASGIKQTDVIGQASQPRRDVTPIAEEVEEVASASASESDGDDGPAAENDSADCSDEDLEDVPDDDDREKERLTAAHHTDALDPTDREHAGIGVTDVVDGVSLSDVADDDNRSCDVADEDDSIEVSSLSSDCDSLAEQTRLGHLQSSAMACFGSPSMRSVTSNHGDASSSGFSSVSRRGGGSPTSSMPSHRSTTGGKFDIDHKVEILQSELLIEKKKNAQLNKKLQTLNERIRHVPGQSCEALDGGDGGRASCTYSRSNSTAGSSDSEQRDAGNSTFDRQNASSDEDAESTAEQLSTHGHREEHCQQQLLDSDHPRGRPVAKVEGQQRNIFVRKEAKEIASLRDTVSQLREQNTQLKTALEVRDKLSQFASSQHFEGDENRESSEQRRLSPAEPRRVPLPDAREEQLQQRLRHVEGELRLAVLTRDQLQTELDEMRRRSSVLTANDCRLSAEVAALLTRNATLEGELSESRERLAASQPLLERSERKLAAYRSEYRKLRALARSLDGLRKKLETENNELAKELRRCRRRHQRDAERSLEARARLEAAAERLSAENEALLDECEEFATAASRLRDKLDDKNDELARMSDLLESSGAILELKTKETQSLEQQVAVLTLVSQGDARGAGRQTATAAAAAAAVAIKESQALREQLAVLQQQLSDADEMHRCVTQAYRCHLIAALEETLSKEVKDALQTIVEMRRLPP